MNNGYARFTITMGADKPGIPIHVARDRIVAIVEGKAGANLIVDGYVNSGDVRSHERDFIPVIKDEWFEKFMQGVREPVNRE